MDPFLGVLHPHGLTYDDILLSFVQGDIYNNSISSKRSGNFHCLVFHFIRTKNLKEEKLFLMTDF